MKKRNLTQKGLVFMLSLFLLSGQVFAQSFSSTAATQPIPDDGYDGTLASMAAMPIEVSGITANELQDLTLELNVMHSWVGDLAIKLQAPDGTIIGLMSRPGFNDLADDGTDCCGSSSDLDGSIITFIDSAADSAEDMGMNGVLPVVGDDGVFSFAPAPGSIGGFASFAEFIAAVTTINGTWTLYIGDSVNLDAGQLDGVTLNITAGTAIPTMSQWGLFLFALVSMSLGLVFMYKMENQQTLSTANGDVSGSFQSQSNLPFEMDVFKAAMKHALGLAVVGFAIILVVWGTIIPMDLIGMTIAIPLVAYMIHIASMLKK